MSQTHAGDEAPRRTLQGLELRCPPLPQTLLQALELMKMPEKMGVGPITEIVSRDPVVAARLLHTANSAHYGLRKQIGSVDRAVVMLGPVAVAGIILGMHMLRLRTIVEGPTAECIERLVRHSTATAYLTRHLIEHARPSGDAASPPSNGMTARLSPRMGMPFTCGLLHDFGKIILIYNYQDNALDVYGRDVVGNAAAVQDGREAERRHFGCDHTEAGAFAARKLHFPEALVDVIRHHHDPPTQAADPETNRITRATAAANLAVKAMGYGHRSGGTVDGIAEHPLWREIAELDSNQETSSGSLFEELLCQKPHLDRYVQHAIEPV